MRQPKRDDGTGCWVVIPAHNEGKHISDVVRDTRKEGFKDIVVVDDGSSDNTASLAKDAILLKHMVNLGKGAAMKTGAEYAFEHGAEAVIFMDGDGQHKPEDLHLFTEKLKDHDIVFSHRRKNGEAPLVRSLGGRMISKVMGLLYGIRLQDALCGFRAIRKDAYGQVEWKSRDYSVEAEMIALAGKADLSYGEVEVHTIYHDKYKGMTPWDGIKVIARLLWWKLTE